MDIIAPSPLTDLEKLRFKSYLRKPDYGSLIWMLSVCFSFLLAVIFFPAYILWHWFDLVADPGLYHHQFLTASAALSAILTIWGMWGELRRSFAPPPPNSPFFADLVGGVAHVQILDVARVIEIEEYEDEGAGFLLELLNGGVLCLISQDYYEYMTDIDLEDGEPDLRDQFPQTKIEYRYGPNSGFVLHAKGIGDSLRPTLKIPRTPKFRKKKGKGGYVYVGPEDGAFYPGTLEDVCRQFGYKPVPI